MNRPMQPGEQRVEILDPGRPDDPVPGAATAPAPPSAPKIHSMLTPEAVVPALSNAVVQNVWPTAIKIVDLRMPEGFALELVVIGASEHKGDTFKNARVEQGVVVTTVAKNLHGTETKPFSAVYLFEEAEPARNGKTFHGPAAPPDVRTVNAAAPQGPVPSREYVQVTTPQGPSYGSVGGGGPQYIHIGGTPAPEPPSHARTYVERPVAPQRVTVQPHEIVALMTRETARRIAFGLKTGGAGLQPQEKPALVYALQQALDLVRDPLRPQIMNPGANEIGIVLSRSQAERAITIIQGTDWLELQGLVMKFEESV